MTIRVPLELRRQNRVGVGFALRSQPRARPSCLRSAPRSISTRRGASSRLRADSCSCLSSPTRAACRGDPIERALPRACIFRPTPSSYPRFCADEAAGVVRDRGLRIPARRTRARVRPNARPIDCRAFSTARAATSPRLDLVARTRSHSPSDSVQIGLELPEPDPEVDLPRDPERDESPETSGWSESRPTAATSRRQRRPDLMDTEEQERGTRPDTDRSRWPWKRSRAREGSAGGLIAGCKCARRCVPEAIFSPLGRGDFGDAGEDPVGLGRSFRLAQQACPASFAKGTRHRRSSGRFRSVRPGEGQAPWIPVRIDLPAVDEGHV